MAFGENKNAVILWDFDIHTNSAIKANRPDIAVGNHNDKTCFLIVCLYLVTQYITQNV